MWKGDEMRKTFLRNTLLLTVLTAIPLNAARAQRDQPVEDKDIKVVEFENLSYPQIARATHITGVVVLRLNLDADGKVLEGQVVSGNPLLTRVCIENAKKWRFKPNSQKAVILVYDFRLDGLCPRNVESSQLLLYPPNLINVTGCVETVQPSRDQTNGQKD